MTSDPKARADYATIDSESVEHVRPGLGRWLARGAAVADRPVGRDRPGGPEGVAAVGQGLTELLVPGAPGRHDLLLLLLGGGHAAALVHQDVVGHVCSPLWSPVRPRW